MRKSMKALAIMWAVMAALDFAAGVVLGASLWAGRITSPVNAIFNVLCASLLTVVLFVGTIDFMSPRKKSQAKDAPSPEER
jgi:hypothetical protein